MKVLRRTALALALSAIPVIAAGCGQNATSRSPSLAGVPLTGGTEVLVHDRRCDNGANAYCAIQLVVVGSRYRTSTSLLTSEAHHLKSEGWTGTGAQTGDEQGADSPGHRLRLTYATAALDLKDIDLGWIQRPRPIALALSRSLFDGTPALSIMLETGST